ncbi:MAG: hypothetical protein Q9162_007263 [Coniocarpon cinnabarinum]
MFGEDVQEHAWPEAVGPMGPYGGFGPTIMAIAWSIFALATLLLSLRFITRYLIQRHAGWALTWTSITWMIGFISQAVFTVAVYRSIDGFSDSWTVPTALRYTWVAIYLTFIAIGIGKFAVIAFILAIQGTTHHRQRYFLYFLGASNITLNVVYVFFLALRCHPVSDMYVLGAATSCVGSNIQARNFGYFVGSWNTASDFILALYPIYLFWNIQIASHVKWGITSVMAIGLVACAMAATKTWDLMFVYNTTRLNYELYCILTWSYVEVWCTIITCSIPPLWPLAKRVISGSRAGFSAAKGWVSSGAESQSGGGWSRVSRRNTMNLIGHGHARVTSSAKAGRCDSTDKDVELLKHPQAIPRSVSRARAEAGCESQVLPDSDRKGASRARDQSINSRKNGKSLMASAASDESEVYDVYEPERGIMMAKDVGRPGIVVTKEYSVETERAREDERGWASSDFGSGRPMRYNWDDPRSV